MKKDLKALLYVGLISAIEFITRQTSTSISNRIALLQMQNMDYVPPSNLGTLALLDLSAVIVIALVTYLLWNKEISDFIKSLKEN